MVMEHNGRTPQMSTPKKWMGFAALGATATALLGRLWRRDDGSDTQAKPVEPTE
jgi:hypothetical protein